MNTLKTERITLHIELTGLITAQFEGEGSERVRELFGSDRIPTPYTLDRVQDTEHFASVVLANIRKLNPDTVVEWSDERTADYQAFQFAQYCRGKAN